MISIIAALAISAHAEEVYRWVDETGVTHYGSTPPQGVSATRVKTSGATSSAASTESGPVANEATTEQTSSNVDSNVNALKKQREQQCADERKRLATLRSGGTRIRMNNPDGSSRYLTIEEIQQEIKLSEQFVNGACGG